MESEFEPPVCIEQARDTDIDELMRALDEGAEKGFLKQRTRESVLEQVSQYYKLEVARKLSWCFQLIPGKEEQWQIDYIELWAVLLCLPETQDSRNIRARLIHEMVLKAQQTARNQSMRLISITNHENLIKRYEWFGAVDAGIIFPERKKLSPHKTLFEFPVN